MTHNKDARIKRLEEALKHLLEVLVKPSTDFDEEWQEAVLEARLALRARI